MPSEQEASQSFNSVMLLQELSKTGRFRRFSLIPPLARTSASAMLPSEFLAAAREEKSGSWNQQ
jgi:hypothetical protein